jgi:hypothetical protein
MQNVPAVAGLATATHTETARTGDTPPAETPQTGWLDRVKNMLPERFR